MPTRCTGSAGSPGPLARTAAESTDRSGANAAELRQAALDSLDQALRPHFARLRELAQEHGLHHLSMGTSQDYKVAAEEGATIVRIGSTLYS